MGRIVRRNNSHCNTGHPCHPLRRSLPLQAVMTVMRLHVYVASHADADETPEDQFRLRQAFGCRRGNRCRRCYATYMRCYRQRKRSLAMQRFAAAVAKETDFRRVSNLCDEMFRRFGGVAAFAKLWVNEVKAAAAKQAGTSRAIKSMLAVLNLQAMVQPHQAANPYSELTDEQLREVLQFKIHSACRDDIQF